MAKNNETSPAQRAACQLNSDRPQIAILDFGSQYSHLIARRVRELHVYCELYSCLVDVATLEQVDVVGVILSGGPSSVYDEKSPHVAPGFWEWLRKKNIPLLGICYGMQELTNHFGGKVLPSDKREYGKSIVRQVGDHGNKGDLFHGLGDDDNIMWMSHGDRVEALPEGFESIAMTDNSPHTLQLQDLSGACMDCNSILKSRTL